MKIYGETKKYGRLEFVLPADTQYVKIRRPDGACDTVEPFWYQPCRVSYNAEGIEVVKREGSGSFRGRYTADSAGKYCVGAYGADRLIEETEIEIRDSDSHGYVEISKKDKKYFSYTDGTPFFSVGINVAFPTAYPISNGKEFGHQNAYGFLGLKEYERWFKKLSANGCNLARIWVGHEYFSPDTEDACTLDDLQFTKIDLLLELAKKYGIKLKLTLEQFRYFNYDRVADTNSYEDDVFRKFNKRLYIGHQKCESASEWLSEDIWLDAWLKKVKEFAKRYAGDTEIFAIELWNEMNCLEGTPDQFLHWNRKVLPKVKEMFPKNFVVNSIGSLDSDAVKSIYGQFCWDKSDFVQIHRYLDQGAAHRDCHKSPIEMIQGAFARMETEKAVFIAETGAVNHCHSGPFKYYVNDDEGILFADAVYTPLFCKSCGVGNIWHWDGRYVESKNLYAKFRPIASLIEGVAFDEEAFEPVDLSANGVSLLLLKGKSTVLGYIRNAGYNWENVLRDLKDVPAVEHVTFQMEGARKIDCFPVFGRDHTQAELKENTVCFSNINIGILFKITCKGR
ncbi:MAG: cellulase family glycosylhydrolase [Clostridia bacterium]|nr:cellulase family glycosylhydrolase [Clostridia bacterium]